MREVYTVVIEENDVLKVCGDYHFIDQAWGECERLMKDGLTKASVIQRFVKG